MSLQTTDYAALTGHLNEIFNETVKIKVTSWIGKMLYDTSSTDWQVYSYQQLDGVAKFERVAEGGQFPVASSAQGDQVTATQRRYGGRVSITKDMRKFERYGEMERLVRSNAEYAMNRIDQSQADLPLNGFTGTSYTDIYGNTQTNTAVDGVVLFSASHSNNQNSTTQRNLIRNAAGTANPDLVRATIVKARSDAKAHKDANGVNRDINLDRLIVAPTQEDLAERLVMSSGPAGTPNVDINPLKSSVNNILVWPRLETSGQGTDTSLYWFMADASIVKDSLHSPFAQQPQMSAANEVHDSLNWEYVIDSYYVIFAGSPFGIWGSTSAGD